MHGSGAWSGAWKDRIGFERLCHTLIVEEVFPNGFVRVIYSNGTYREWNVREPYFQRATSRIYVDELRFKLRSGRAIAYRFTKQELKGTFHSKGGKNRALLKKVEDISQQDNQRLNWTPLTLGSYPTPTHFSWNVGNKKLPSMTHSLGFRTVQING